MAIKNSKRFAEVEYCLQHYFNAQLVPIMSKVQSNLNQKQAKELAEYQTSFAGIMRSAANTMAGRMDDSVQFLKLTGEWNSKTTEDYVDMCRKNIASNKSLQKDFATMAAEWRNTVVAEIGRPRYDALSKQLGGDLAFAYVDYRVEQMMIDHLVEQKVPKSSMDYIFQKTAEGSLFGISSILSRTPLDNEIASRCEKAYNPSLAEKGTARIASFAIDTVAIGGCGSWASIGKLAGAEIVFSGVGAYLDHKNKVEKVMTVEDCISRGVFGSNQNVFTEFRKNSKRINSWENNYVLSINNSLTKKMGIATTKPFYIDALKPKNVIPLPFTNQRKPEHANVPMMIAPGHEEEYLANKKKLDDQNKAEAEAKAKAEVEAQKQKEAEIAAQQKKEAEKEQENEEKQDIQPLQNDNSSGWGNFLNSVGFGSLEDIGSNLGYVISMLPDILVGLFTGKTKNINLDNSMLPLASIVTGMFVKNPLLKMTLMGLGGLKLVNNAGEEILERKVTEEGASVPQGRVQYKTYNEEPLNPRITNPTLQGNCLIATIDKVPCTIQLPEKVVNAYNAGALPLSTLANAILEKSDQTQMMAQNNYREVEDRTDNRERTVGIK